MSRRSIHLSVVVLAFCVSTALAEYAYTDLIGHKERWPAEVTLLKDVKTRKGVLPAGTKLPIYDLNKHGLMLDNGGLPLPVPPDDTDLIAAANAKTSGGGATGEEPAKPADATLLDAAGVAADSSLWPETIKLLVARQIKNPDGDTINLAAGTVCDVVYVDAEGVFCVPQGTDHRVKFWPGYTDLLDRAKERAAMEPAKRTSRVIEALRKSLIDSNGNAFESPGLDETKIFVLYYGGNYCQPCHLVSPHIVKWVKANSAANPHMTVVMINDDDEVGEMLAYMKSEKMPWPSIKKADWHANAYLRVMAPGAFPVVLITDRFGKEIYKSTNADKSGIRQHLAALQQISDSGAAK